MLLLLGRPTLKLVTDDFMNGIHLATELLKKIPVSF
jgi:hypothetical protein